MTTSLSTENAANFRVKYFPPDRFTVCRPYCVQAILGSASNSKGPYRRRDPSRTQRHSLRGLV